MPYLDHKDKEELRALGLTERGEIIRNLIEQNLKEIGDVSTLDSDPIESRKKVIKHLETNLLAYFRENPPVEKQEVETYE